MNNPARRPNIGAVIYFTAAFMAGSYFTFAAVQGENGVFRHVQVQAEAATLRDQRDALAAQLAVLKNRTRRLSDKYLDLDLLGQQAREVLGYLRPDEIVIR